MRAVLAGALRSGLIAGLLVAGRELPLEAFALDLGDPVVFARGTALVLVAFALMGLVVGLALGMLIGLLRSPLRRIAGPVSPAARLGLAAAGVVVLGARSVSGGAPAELWLATGVLALLLEAGRRVGPAAPRERATAGGGVGLAAVLGLLAADMLCFGAWRVLGERHAGGLQGLLLYAGALLAALTAGLAVFALLRWAGRRAGPRAGLVAGTVLVVAVLGLAGWQLAAGVSGLDAQLARAQGRWPAEPADSGTPSVILISVDALRADFPGYAGGPARTPTLDALADQSYVFERAWSVAPWTRPSFAAFFGGRYPSEMGVGRAEGAALRSPGFFPVRWDPQVQTFPEVLDAAGYATAAVVTNGNLTREAHADQGFDLFYHASLHPGVGLMQLAGRPLASTRYDWETLERAELVTVAAARAAAALPGGPALLWVHYMDPHQPYDPPTIEPDERAAVSALTMAGADAVSAPERQRFVRAYTAEIEYCDRWLGELVRALKDTGLWDRSVVVLWSDHGEEFWEHGGVDHGQSLHDEQLRVPLLIRLPGQRAGVRVTEPVSLLDLAPTMLELCGQAAPEGMRGRSLVPVLRDEPGPLPPFRVFLEGCRRGALRTGWLDGRYKLVHDRYLDRRMLFDLRSDPAERHDLHGQPRAPDTRPWEAELDAWSTYALTLMARRAGRGAEHVPEELREQLRDMGYVN